MITLIPKRKILAGEASGQITKPLAFDYTKQDIRAVESKLHNVGYAYGLTRAWDTTYQNTSGRIRIVTVSCIFTCQDNEGAKITATMGKTSALGTSANRISLYNNGTGTTGYIRAILSMTFIVPTGWYYQCASEEYEGSPTYTKGDWVEYDLHSAAPQA